MIGLWLETLSDVELQRVSDAPSMVYGLFFDCGTGDVCLVNTSRGTSDWGVHWSDRTLCVAERFDEMGQRFMGRPRGQSGYGPAPRPMLSMIQNRARRILARRAIAALPTNNKEGTMTH